MPKEVPDWIVALLADSACTYGGFPAAPGILFHSGVPFEEESQGGGLELSQCAGFMMVGTHAFMRCSCFKFYGMGLGPEKGRDS